MSISKSKQLQAQAMRRGRLIGAVECAKKAAYVAVGQSDLLDDLSRDQLKQAHELLCAVEQRAWEKAP